MRNRPSSHVRFAAMIAGTVLACAWVSAPAGARPTEAERPDLVPVPEPDTEGMNPAVRAQLAEHNELVARLLTEPATLPDELSQVFGDGGGLYYTYRQYEAASASFANARSLAPEDVRWTYYLALTQAKQGRFSDAAASFEATLELTPDMLPALLHLGDIQLTADQTEAAHETYQRAVELDAESAAAHFGLGRVAAAQGETELAAEHFETVLELQPRANIVHYHLGLAYRQLGQLDKARDHLRQRGSEKPRFADPLSESISDLATGAAAEHLRATRALRRGNLDEAIALFHKALEANPDAMQVLLGLATALQRAGKPAEALEQYRSAVRQGARDPLLFLNYGALLAQLGSSDQAIDAFREAVALSPDFRDAHFNLGIELKRRGQLESAVRHLQLAVDLDPEDTDGRLELASALGLVGRGDESLARFEALIAEDPSNPRVRLELALALGRAERFTEAAAEYTRFLELEPDYADAHVGRAMALLLGDRCATARRSLEESLRRLSGNLQLRHLLARVLATCPVDEGRDGTRALELANQVLREQTSLDHVETLAMAYAELGRFEDAALWQRRAVEEAEKRGWSGPLQGLRKRLALYERGEPCREPWKG